MSVMLGELYKALLAPSEEQARKAAEEVAAYENRLASLDTKVTVLTWMVATNVMLTTGVLIRLLWMRP